MDLQKIFDMTQKASRLDRLETTKQLILIEIISKLETVQDKTKPVVFDDGAFIPESIDSWRGVYAELAISYDIAGETEPLTVNEWITTLNSCIGKVFEGYKGGDFKMSKVTPVWIANYGESSGFKSDEENSLYHQGIVDVQENESFVSFITEAMDT